MRTTDPTSTPSGGASRAGSVALALVTCLCVLRLVAFVVVQAPQAFDGRHPPDFPNYYLAGSRVLEGRPVYVPLAPEVRERLGWSYSFAAPADPPFAVAMLAPLALLPYHVAWWCLFATSLVVLPATTWFVAREIGWSRRVAEAAAAGSCVTVHARYLLGFNHLESLVLLATVLGWRALRRDRDVATGLWWGVAVALKLFPGVLLVALALARRWRAFAVGCAATVAFLAIGGVAVGADDVRRFVLDVLPQARHFIGRLGNFSLLSVATGLFGAVAGWSVELLGIVWLGWLLYARSASADRVWVTATAGALLVSPLSWIGYPVLVWPCLLVVVATMDIQRRSTWLATTALGLVLGFWRDSFYLPDARLNLAVSSMPTAGLVVLAAMGARRLR